LLPAWIRTKILFFRHCDWYNTENEACTVTMRPGYQVGGKINRSGSMKQIGGCMYRVLGLLVLISLILPNDSSSAAERDPSDISSSFTLPAPREIIDVYLRFHERDLCEGVEAVFVPGDDCLRIWCRVEDRGRYRELLKLLEPVSASTGIEMYAAEPVSEDGSEEEDALPPSLWENDELRHLLWIPMIRSSMNASADTPFFMVSPEDIFKQRLLIFSEQTIDRSLELEKFAGELPTLTHLALDSSLDDELRALAANVCRAHSKKVSKIAGKLEKNINQALPGKNSTGELEMLDTAADLQALAKRIAIESHNIARCVYLFIYPDQYTVKLDELRNPNLLSSLCYLQVLTEAYTDRIEDILTGY